MNYSFHPEAEKEFEEAITYYEEKQIGLGFDFAIEIHSAIERAARQPNIWPLIEEEIRRSMANRFPYGVLYSEEKDGIFIVAVMHLHRDPDYWKHRI